jgi:hypothetical protein
VPERVDQRRSRRHRRVFWGRSPAARWRISISALDAAAAELNLAGLTEIQLAVKYAYYNPTAGLAKKVVAA